LSSNKECNGERYYGPFKAAFNDVDIFKYILATENHLKELVQPPEKIYFFLDRDKIINELIIK
jgi:hypothetical protein